MAERRNTQPSLLRMMQARFLSQIKAYKKAKQELDDYEEALGNYAPTHEDAGWRKLRDKERLLRGVVRGAAQMLIIVATPHEAKDNDAINDLEVDSGMPGKRSKPKARASEFAKAFLDLYYGRNE